MTVEIVYGLEEGEAVEAGAVAVSTYVYKPNHADEAEGWLLTQFDNSPKLHAWVRSLVKPYQTLEDVLNVLRSAFDPNTAVGDQLTQIGAIVGEDRADRNDANLRAYVLARIAVNTSDGTAGNIYRVARLILGPDAHSLWIEALPPAKYVLHVQGATLSYPWDNTEPASSVANALADLITQATSAGVGVILHFQTTDDANTFTFASGDVTETDANRGFADDAGSVGGQLTDYALGG